MSLILCHPIPGNPLLTTGLDTVLVPTPSVARPVNLTPRWELRPNGTTLPFVRLRAQDLLLSVGGGATLPETMAEVQNLPVLVSTWTPNLGPRLFAHVAQQHLPPQCCFLAGSVLYQLCTESWQAVEAVYSNVEPSLRSSPEHIALANEAHDSFVGPAMFVRVTPAHLLPKECTEQPVLPGVSNADLLRILRALMEHALGYNREANLNEVIDLHDRLSKLPYA